MALRSGIPTLTEVDDLLRGDLFRAHQAFNAAFLKQHDAVMRRYARAWVYDVFGHWSRRWEYPYVVSHLVEFGRQRFENKPYRVLDAGSGVSYMPHYLCDQLPQAQITCCDFNAAYGTFFDDIRRNGGCERIKFISGAIQNLPVETASADAIGCVSVLEHTGDYDKVVDEFHRVLAPGGLLVLTFDIGLDRKFEVLPEKAKQILEMLSKKFDPADGADWMADFAKIERPDELKDLLTTDAVKRTQPDLLPWKYPMIQAAYDFWRGHGWTGGFRSVAAFCLAAMRK